MPWEKKIPSLYEECCSKVKRCLDAAHSVVLTTDMWTSRATEAYLTVTAYVLKTSSFSGKHSADGICSELQRITEEWGLTAKIQAVVTDNGANMVAAVHKAGWAHYPCFAHTINLVVKDSIKTLPELLDIQHRCSAIVSFFSPQHKSNRKAQRNTETTKVSRAQTHPVS